MSNAETRISSGGCYCGAVRYQVTGPLRGVVNCHCSQCTALNGNFGSHSKALKANIKIIRDDGLAWFRISDTARRGFCRECGSGLFWEHLQQDALGIVAGSLDRPTGLKTIGHIFVAEKSDFYEITDHCKQFQQSSEGEFEGDYR
jgi:hypothetical protein